MNVLFAYLPIVLLIYLMTKKKSMPSNKALPLTALVLYFICLVVFRFEPNLVHANVVKGLLVALTPILIIAGAIFLFRTMEITGSLAVIRQWLNSISSNKIAQLMIVGWAFVFLIEGASGFGTPAALAAPILVGLGFPPVRVAILTLIMNSISVSFGAVGTPTWFGLSAVNLTKEETLIIAFKSAILNGTAALFIPILALLFVVKYKSIINNLLFIFLSVISTIVPYIVIAKFNYEFPSLVGGFTGLLSTVILAKYRIGLSHKKTQLHESVGKSDLLRKERIGTVDIKGSALVKALFPLWGTILLLVITRIPYLGIKQLLVSNLHVLQLELGSLGVLSVSSSLVLTLDNIFQSVESWQMQLLYVPSIIPFMVISYITFVLYKSSGFKRAEVLKGTYLQMKKPTAALLGALVFVNLVMMGGENSIVNLIGNNLAELTGNSWKYFASFLGGLGTFFSGSNTISNLTFAGIQDSIAANLNIDRTTILALQSAGGSMGSMVSINNIVAVSSVLALGNKEGYILKRTSMVMLVFGVIIGVLAIFI